MFIYRFLSLKCQKAGKKASHVRNHIFKDQNKPILASKYLPDLFRPKILYAKFIMIIINHLIVFRIALKYFDYSSLLLQCNRVIKYLLSQKIIFLFSFPLCSVGSPRWKTSMILFPRCFCAILAWPRISFNIGLKYILKSIY